MSVIQLDIPLFGPERTSWLNVIKYYNDYKVGYDGAILAFQQGYTDASQLPPGGNVPVENRGTPLGPLFDMPGPVEDTKNQTVMGKDMRGLVFEVPLRLGYHALITARLSRWQGMYLLAEKKVKATFSDQKTVSKNILPADDQDLFGYVRIILKKTQADALNMSLIETINTIRRENQGDPLTKRLFLLRVQQEIWPIIDSKGVLNNDEEKREMVCRDDSIIINFKDGKDSDSTSSN